MPELPLEGLAPFDELVAEIMAEWRIPGLAIAVLRRDEPPLLRCWGLRDIDTRAPASPGTVFPICSVTKSFTPGGADGPGAETAAAPVRHTVRVVD
jgi:hypothetical protein